MIGLLYVAVLGVQLALPDGNALRSATGENAAPWLILGGSAALVWLYRRVLAKIRARAEVTQETLAKVTAVPSKGMSEVELERYARHIVLREVGGPGQMRLRGAKVLVVGAGGLGSPALIYLAGAGVGTIGVIDDDIVSLSNLQRQIIHTDERSGLPKVFSAEAAMTALNPHVTVRPYHRRLTAAIAEELFAEYDLILDGSDSFETRQMINAAAVATGRPLVAGAIAQWEGQVTIYDPAGGAPCLACLFPQAPAPGQAPSCAEAGVIGALPGVVGSMMALEAIKEITGAGETLRGKLLIYDGLYAETRLVKIKRQAECACCGGI
jgi:molybdopterin/thiamine biosynthesis adenylyltransferase